MIPCGITRYNGPSVAEGLMNKGIETVVMVTGSTSGDVMTEILEGGLVLGSPTCAWGFASHG